jgi:hypothetical protein
MNLKSSFEGMPIVTGRKQREQIKAIADCFKKRFENGEQKRTILKASRSWSCHCGCDTEIKAGESFYIKNGSMYHLNHEESAILEVKRDYSKITSKQEAQREISELPLFTKEHSEQLALAL